MTTATATITKTDEEIIGELEGSFDSFRGRIALLSIEACGTLTAMFTPMVPHELTLIDIDAIESEQIELELDFIEVEAHESSVAECSADETLATAATLAA